MKLLSQAKQREIAAGAAAYTGHRRASREMSTRRSVRPCARALFKFEGQTEHELSFSPGESILLLRRIDENWVEGELNGKVGIFPNNHVRIELGSPSLSHESVLARSGKPYGIALYSFAGSCEGDLTLEKGELVELLSSVGGGWMRGKTEDREGIFPSSFVEVFQPLAGKPTPKPRQLSYPDVTTFPKPKPRLSTRQKALPRVRRMTAPVLSREVQCSVGGNAEEQKQLSPSTPPTPQPRTRQNSVSALEYQLSSLQSNLEVEEKMLKSAKSLLKVGTIHNYCLITIEGYCLFIATCIPIANASITGIGLYKHAIRLGFNRIPVIYTVYIQVT